MKKLFRLVPIALFGFCLVFNSCSDDQEMEDSNASIAKESKTDETLQRFLDHSNLTLVQSNLKNTQIFKSKFSNETIRLEDLGDNNWNLKKFDEEGIEVKEIEVELIVKKSGFAELIFFNKKDSVYTSFSLDNKATVISKELSLNSEAGGLCQREKGEKFKDCFKREADEFCDGFFSCIAIATHPVISILIAALCSC